MKKLTTEGFMERAGKMHENKYNYSKVKYVGNRIKVCIICKKHGEFWQIPNNHWKGHGCSKCGREVFASKMKGVKFSNEHKQKISEAHRGRISNRKGKCHSKEAKKKMRISAIKRIEERNGIIFPSYNKTACEYFKKFDEGNNTQGRYATNGGEFYIKKLGYWPDYINFDLKLIMEWDEEKHFIGNELKEKDINRQKEIQNHFPNFEFKRIREGRVKSFL